MSSSEAAIDRTTDLLGALFARNRRWISKARRRRRCVALLAAAAVIAGGAVAAFSRPAEFSGYWANPVLLGLGVGVTVMLAGLVVGHLFRRAGRDWLAVDHSTGPIGARVDDVRLADLIGIAFAPPRDLSAWQGGLLFAEEPRPEHRAAWLLDAVNDGYVSLHELESSAPILRRLDHRPDETTALLDHAFNGRDEIDLGTYDLRFREMWYALSDYQRQWWRSSGFHDPAADKRATVAMTVGLLALLPAAAGLFLSTRAAVTISSAWVVALWFGALLFGTAIASALRSWELRVRTAVGTGLWLRVESFRRFIAASEAHHATAAAQRGVLREYAAWAVALGESDHWNHVLAAASYPPVTMFGPNAYGAPCG